MGHINVFTTSFLQISVFSTALWDLANTRPVHPLMLSSHLLFCLPCLLPPLTVPCKTVLARPDERETCPYYFSLRLFTMARSSCRPVAFLILAQTSLLVTWSSCEMLAPCGSTSFLTGLGWGRNLNFCVIFSKVIAEALLFMMRALKSSRMSLRKGQRWKTCGAWTKDQCCVRHDVQCVMKMKGVWNSHYIFGWTLANEKSSK